MKGWVVALACLVLVGCDGRPSVQEQINAYHEAVIALCNDEATGDDYEWAKVCARELDRLLHRLAGEKS